MTEYIKYLRAFVGHRPVLQVGASIIVEDEDGRVLLQKRRDNHCWGYHGGSVELDECVEDAAARELYEETGLIADDLQLWRVFSGPDTHYVYPNGDEVSNVDLVFICRKYHGQIRQQESEVEELKFFALDEMPENISPPIAKALQEYVKMKKA
ncbi:MAG: NUDIX hydrolase [Clostridia bacterium]|nr:NUDIX hydrolase [Clostridia bacterium]